MKPVALQIEVPIACFRQSRDREYIGTYSVPPPSTVYGMLLSLVGETDRYRHCGTRLAIALLSKPDRSVVIRTFHRHKTKNPLEASNIRPDYQELLTGIKFVVWVDASLDEANPNLAQRIQEAFAHPSHVDRFGGLSLGESQHLVNAITLVTHDSLAGSLGFWLVQQDRGQLTLPYWVNHVGSRGTCWKRYDLQESSLYQSLELAWTEIRSSEE